jgi:DNA-binding transcriptional LysR family regulator
MGTELLFEDLRNQGLRAPSIRYAPNLSTVMLWVEAGLGVGIINHQSNLARNPNVRLISEIPLSDASPCVAWRKDNLNPAIALFDQLMEQYWDK